MKTENLIAFGIVFALCVLLVVVVPFVLGAITWTWSINTWLVIMGNTPVVVWWQGGLIGLVPTIGYFGVPVAIVTWIVSLFMS